MNGDEDDVVASGRTMLWRDLGELCATRNWHRNHARKSLAAALRPRVLRSRKPRQPRCGLEPVAAPGLCWAMLGAPDPQAAGPDHGRAGARLRRIRKLVFSGGGRAR